MMYSIGKFVAFDCDRNKMVVMSQVSRQTVAQVCSVFLEGRCCSW